MKEFIKDSEFYLPYWRAGALLRKLLNDFNPYTSEMMQSKSLFFHIPKTAGTSISTAVYGVRSFHYPAGRYYLYDPEAFKQFYKFTFVRNPFDRLLSAYSYLYTVVGQTHMRDGVFATDYLKQADDFHKFVLKLQDAKYRKSVLRYVHFRPQTMWMIVPGKFGPQDMDFIGKFEDLENNLNALESKISFKGELPHLRPSVHGHYKDIYTPKMRKIVEDLYEIDFKNFAYKF